MTFAQFNFNDNIFKAISACGYSKPTPIQVNSIPEIMLGHDIVASAPTGTGKTAAFVLPALHRLCLSQPAKKPRILILTPTRELASQITQGASKYGKYLKFNIVSLIGGMPYRQQLRDLSRPVDVIVATPGRLLDHMENKRLDLSGVEMLILDEADRMLDMGFIDDVKAIAKATPEDRQTLLFSATVDDRLARIIRQLLKDPKRIDFSQQAMAPTQIRQEAYLADNIAHKNRLLQHFLDNGNIFKAIIFSATKIHCDQLANDLCRQGYEAAALHGDLRQQVRNRTLEKMRRGKVQFLVATDVAARGIDIHDVTHVINFDLPKFSEDYVHRIGRTGRAGRDGVAISLVLPSDARHLQKIERYTGKSLSLSVVEGLEPTKRLVKSGPAGGGAAGKKKPFGKGKPSGFKSQRAFGKSSKDFGDKPRRSFRDDVKPRGEFKARDDARARDDFKPRKDFKARDDFKPRGDFKPRDDFKSRDGFKPRKDFKERDDFKPRGDFKARGEFKPRGEFKSRDDAKPRDGFKPRKDFKGRDDFKPRGDAKARGDFKSRDKSKFREEEPRQKARPYGKSANSESRSTDPRVSYGKSQGGRQDRGDRPRQNVGKSSRFAKKPH